jgi:tRNA U34 2-thiouridine synthase MnmA/TrmU
MEQVMTKRCIALYSGGLDSILAIKIMEEQGIDVIPLYFCTPFFGFDALRDPEAFKKAHTDKYNINIHIIDYTNDITRIVNEPPHGFGKHLNPCIDCKIGMLRKAKELLDKMDASFVITGEVLGQRPMSQRSDTMNVIEKESGLQDILLRPLCAQHLIETLPERMGIIRREGLWDISGRGRKIQIERALEYGIKKEDMPTPAGGCLLTDEQISYKVKRTFARFSPELPEKADLVADVLGREFVLNRRTILVVGRDEKENDIISTIVYPGNIFLKVDDVPGPLCILRGNDTDEYMALAAGICLRYSKAKGTPGQRVVYGPDPLCMVEAITAPVFSEEYCKSFQD